MNLVYASAAALAEAIRTKHASATEMLDAHLAQIDRHNPSLNAVVTIDVEGARARARQADEALGRNEVWGPLHGVPFTLKDAHATAGMRTTVGFPPLAEHVPREDGTVARRLKEAGAILVGKTNVAEMLADFQTNNPVFGRTSNPWDPARTPGGSSGGAAAAVASGMSPFDVGTDLSGSIRIPVAYCGVFGLKPTERRVSMIGVVPDPRGTPRSVRIMASVGPIARTVDDLALVFRIIAGPDGLDTEVEPVPVEPPPEIALKTLRVAVAPTIAGLPVAADIRAAVDALAARLQPACAIVDEAPLPAIDVARDLKATGELIGMVLGAFQPSGSKPAATLAQYLEALHHRDRSIVAWERFFAQWDVLVGPASMVTAFPHCQPGSRLRVDDRDEDYLAVSAHAALFNYSGHPAVTVPCGRDRDGLPIGLQLVGKRWDEARLLGIARAVSAVSGGFTPPPSTTV
jgi:amidase